MMRLGWMGSGGGRRGRESALALALMLSALKTVGCSGTYMSGDSDTGGSSGDGTGGLSTGGAAAGGSDSGGSNSGGSAAGGSAAGGQPGSGGVGGNNGTGGDDCGPCPGVACMPGLELYVTSESTEGTVNLRDLTAEAEGFTVDCSVQDGCNAHCASPYNFADGHYSVTLSATGATPLVVEFDIVNPTNCGCCGCCPGSYFEQVVMVPSPDVDDSRACCADLAADEANCGTCGHLCQDFEACINGNCVPTP